MKLYPYQETGVDFLAGRKFALLADFMGLGKTAQTVRALDWIAAEDVLVIGPAIVRSGWVKAFHRWSPIGHEVAAINTGRDPLPGRGAIICSYELATAKAMRKRLLARRFDVLVLDEAHYLKNATAQRTRAIYGPRCDLNNALAQRAERVWCLTGTPMPNHPAELWPMLRAFGRYEKGYASFLRTFCTGSDGPYGFKVTGVRNADALKRLLSPIMLRRTWEDVDLQLPPLIVQEYSVEAGEVPLDFFASDGWLGNPERARRELSEQTQLIQTLLRTTDRKDRVKVLSSIITSVSTLRRYVGLAKVRTTAQFIETLLKENPNRKVVAYCQHRLVMNWLKEELITWKPALYWGGMNPDRRARIVNTFLTRKQCRVFIGQLKAAGTGLDGLQTVANTVLIVEPSWSPAENAQCIMRLHRNGQERPVRAFFISASDTIDEAVNRVLRRKSETLLHVIGS